MPVGMFRNAPLAWTAICLSLGILLADRLSWPVLVWLAVAAIAGGITLGLLFRKHRSLFLALPLGLLFLGTGAAHWQLWFSPRPNSIPTDTTAIAWVTVRSAPQPTSYGLRFRAEVQMLLVGKDTLRLPFFLEIVVSGVDTLQHGLPELRCGDQIFVGGRLEPLPAPRNPGQIDHRPRLRRQGVVAQLRVQDPRLLQPIVSGQCFPYSWLEPLKRRIKQDLTQAIPDPEAQSIVQALVLGDRSGLHWETRGQLGRAGLAHLLAISGLHVMFVGLVLYALLRPLLLRLGLSWWGMEWTRTLLTLLIVLGYVWLAGAPASAVRALVMTGLLLGATLRQVPAHPFNSLGAAALLILLVDPSQLFEPGFQLSFAAVCGLIGGLGSLQQHLPKRLLRSSIGRYLTGSLLATLTATLTTAPFMLLHFGYVSWAGLPLNLIGIPLGSGALSAGLLTALSALLSPAVGQLFGGAATLCAQGLLWLGSLADKAFAGWVMYYPHPPLWLLLLPPLLLGLLSRSFKFRRLALGLMLGCSCAGVWLSRPVSPTLDVVFFDVGHGDATLIRTPNGRHLLIDVGGYAFEEATLYWNVLPFLRWQGIHYLDVLLLTHPDADHIGGAPTLLRRIKVGRVLDNGASDTSRIAREVQQVLDSLGLARYPLAAGDTIHLEDAVVLQVLAPGVASMQPSDNERSVVLRMVYGNTRWLFLGDAEAGLESQLVRAYGALLQSDVVKVGHHGSSTSSTPALVEAVFPETTHAGWAVISTGWRGVSPQVHQRWLQQKAKVWITATSGALWLRSDGRHIWPVNQW
ncbi:ComE operon protein 3 [bacterium HR18]|uniref:DNA internalization-related competence protein ComEC/Rec2 n=1 Tax=Rhodothermus marinus TaxID=29549 RepID=A0A7V2F6V7_RHOMR|nr:ComE operon protein 3 [bacterium HR18]